MCSKVYNTKIVLQCWANERFTNMFVCTWMILMVYVVSSDSETSRRVLQFGVKCGGKSGFALPVFLQAILLFRLIKNVSELFSWTFSYPFECGVKVTRLGIALHTGSSLPRCKGQNIGAKLIMQRLGNDRKGSPLTSYSIDTQAALTHLKSRDIPM